jgi:hypothetical protein
VSDIGWNRRYAIVSYLRSSLWTVPYFALVVEQIGVRFLTFIDQCLRWVPALVLTAAEAGDALAAIESLTIALLARSPDRQGLGGPSTNYMKLHVPQQSRRANVQR